MDAEQPIFPRNSLPHKLAKSTLYNVHPKLTTDEVSQVLTPANKLSLLDLLS